MSAEIKVEISSSTEVVKADVTVTHRLGDIEQYMAGLLITALVAALCLSVGFMASCTGPQIHIQDPVSMQMWTDAEGQPDPLAECQRMTQGGCVVMSGEALAWWQTRWAACEELLEGCKK